MTVETENSRIIVQGNGATISFSYDFPIVGASDTDQSNCQLIYTDTTGVSTTQTINLWSITGVVTQPTDWLAGTFRLATSTPITTGTTLTLERTQAYEQTTTLGNQGAYSPEVVEAALDNLALQTEQLNTWRLQSIRAPITDAALDDLPGEAERADSYLFFDSDGQPTVVNVNTGLPSSIYIGTNSTSATLTQELLITGDLVNSLATVAGVTTVTLGNFGGALLVKTSTQSVTGSAETVFSWGSASYDVGGYSNIGSHNTRLTVPTGVTRVRLYGGSILATSSAIALYFKKNGVTAFSGGAHQGFFGSALTDEASIASPPVSVSAADYFELAVFNASTTTNALTTGGTFFAMEKVT